MSLSQQKMRSIRSYADFLLRAEGDYNEEEIEAVESYYQKGLELANMDSYTP